MEQKDSVFRKTWKGKSNNICDGFSRVCHLGLPPQVLCPQEGLSLKPGDINGKKLSGTKRFWIRTLLSPVHIWKKTQKSSFHQLDHLVSLFCSLLLLFKKFQDRAGHERASTLFTETAPETGECKSSSWCRGNMMCSLARQSLFWWIWPIFLPLIQWQRTLPCELSHKSWLEVVVGLDGPRVGLGIRKPHGFGEATKPSLLNFPLVGKGEFTYSLTSAGCGDDWGQLLKTTWPSFLINQRQQ